MHIYIYIYKHSIYIYVCTSILHFYYINTENKKWSIISRTRRSYILHFENTFAHNKCLILIIDESSSSSLSRTTPIKCWLVVYLYPSEKYDFVSWDYYSNIWKVIKFHGSSHHQPVHDCHLPINFMKIMVIFYSYVNLYLRASLPMAIQGIQGSVSSPLPPSYRLQPRQWMFFLVNGG